MDGKFDAQSSIVASVNSHDFRYTFRACDSDLWVLTTKGRSLCAPHGVVAFLWVREQRGGHTERRQPLETGSPSRSYCFSSMNRRFSPLSSACFVRYFYRLTPTRRHLLLPLDYSTTSVSRSGRPQTMINNDDREALRRFKAILCLDIS